jgi:hypothetical protein
MIILSETRTIEAKGRKLADEECAAICLRVNSLLDRQESELRAILSTIQDEASIILSLESL